MQLSGADFQKVIGERGEENALGARYTSVLLFQESVGTHKGLVGIS